MSTLPCLHRVEDDDPTGLPFICTLDKGHDGPHAETDGTGWSRPLQ